MNKLQSLYLHGKCIYSRMVKKRFNDAAKYDVPVFIRLRRKVNQNNLLNI